MAFLLHPQSGHVTLTVNGEHITGPLGTISAFALALFIGLVAGILGVLILIGVGAAVIWVVVLVGISLLGVMAPFLIPVILLVIFVYAVARMLQ